MAGISKEERTRRQAAAEKVEAAPKADAPNAGAEDADREMDSYLGISDAPEMLPATAPTSAGTFEGSADIAEPGALGAGVGLTSSPGNAQSPEAMLAELDRMRERILQQYGLGGAKPAGEVLPEWYSNPQGRVLRATPALHKHRRKMRLAPCDAPPEYAAKKKR